MMRARSCTALLVLCAAGFCLAGQPVRAEDAAAEVAKYRERRDARLRGPLSPLALVHREYLKERDKVTLGSSAEADIRLEGEGVAPLHAVLEGTSKRPTLRASNGAKLWTLDTPARSYTQQILKSGNRFRIGRYHLLYKDHVSWGRIIEVYDTELPAYLNFKGLDFYPFDAAYRVEAEVVPAEKPEQIDLIDSHGSPRPVWIYGELRFKLHGTDCRLELYTGSTDPKEVEQGEFMLIFADATSGKQTYPAARYLDVPGKAAGTITVDFNQAYSPPCSFSSVYTCPFPRPQNRLPVAVEAGEKWYHAGKGEGK